MAAAVVAAMVLTMLLPGCGARRPDLVAPGGGRNAARDPARRRAGHDPPPFAPDPGDLDRASCQPDREPRPRLSAADQSGSRLPGWRPRFIDYLYLGFTNATAFSPTDVMPLVPWAKIAMAFQAAVSLPCSVSSSRAQ
jgi:hypothetical protein